MPGLQISSGGCLVLVKDFLGRVFAMPGVSPLQDVKMLMHIQVRSHEASQAPGLSLAEPGQTSLAQNPPVPGGQRSAGSREVPVQRLVTQNPSARSVWGEDAQKVHPSSCLLLEKCLEEQLFFLCVCYWCWWNCWESGWASSGCVQRWEIDL